MVECEVQDKGVWEQMPRVRKEELEELVPASEIKYNEPMSSHTTFRIGGPADMLVIPHNVSDLKAVLRYAHQNRIPLYVMGNGSNLLVADEGVQGIVVKLAGTLDEVKIDGHLLTVGAGILLPKLARIAAEHGLSGLEFAADIPGTVGGALVMNAAAYGSEMKNVVTRVITVDYQGARHTYRTEELGYGYKQSVLQNKAEIVVCAEFSLEPTSPEAVRDTMVELHARRTTKQPLDFPSAGSTFRRPPGHYAGALIEQAGFKGKRIGDAQVSPLHAGFIINRGKATAKEVLKLIDEIKKAVKAKFGVELELEIRVIGERKTCRKTTGKSGIKTKLI